MSRAVINDRDRWLYAAMGLDPDADACYPLSHNSLVAYRRWHKDFTSLYGGGLPFAEGDITKWLDDLATERNRKGGKRFTKATIQQAYAAILFVAKSAGCPFTPEERNRMDAELRWILVAPDDREPKRAEGLRFETIKRLVDRKAERPDVLALISLAYNCGLRRGEAVAVRRRHIDIHQHGTGTLYIPRSKTDRKGRGEYRPISAWTMAQLHAINIQALDPPATLFRFSPQRYGQIMAELGHRHGLGRITGHSPRIGMAQDLRRQGHTIAEIAQAGRWKSYDMVALYTRNHQAAGVEGNAVSDLMDGAQTP